MLEVRFNNWVCNVEKARYGNGNMALRLVEVGSHEPIATCTVNLEPLPDGLIAVKDYSENEGMFKALKSSGLIVDVVAVIPCGLVSAPVCLINLDLLEDDENVD